MKLRIAAFVLIIKSLFCIYLFAGGQRDNNHLSEINITGNPNVILIMTDDQGYGELSVHGNPILQTPNLDKLHQQSIRFTNFHVAPMCTPTRGQLLTGLDAVKNGAVNVSSGRSLLRQGIKTMADFFSENGYNTGIFGKWHLGENYPFRPEDRGFNETLWFPSSHVGSVPDYWGNDYFNDLYIRNGIHEKGTGYCTDVFFKNAIEWIKQCSETETPFFCYLPTNAPHQPFYAKENDIAEIENLVSKFDLPGMDNQKKHNFIRYLAMIRNIDQNMGLLNDFLDKLGLVENTILVFLTDNGSTFGPDYYNAGMRGRKTQLYEGGHRVPLFIRWDGGEGFDTPRDIDGLAQVQDILPTILDLCEINYGNHHFSGQSLASVIAGTQMIPEDRILFINYSRMPFYFDYPSPYSNSLITESGTAVLWKNWRLLQNNEFYDLSADPLQQHNVIEKYPGVVAFMKKQRAEWWSEVENSVNKPERIIIGSNKENPSMLSACDWLDVFVDQQKQVKKGVRKNSYWLLEVAEKGSYEFELRRWPREYGLPLNRSGKDEVELHIASARIFIKGEGKYIQRRSDIKDGANKVRFNVELEPGPIALHTWFDDSNGETISGAYYVYVNKK